MVQFIADFGCFGAMDHLTIGRAVLINVDCSQIIRFLHPGPGVNANRVNDFFARCLYGVLRRCIARTRTAASIGI